jgi:hypothetical protein
LDCKTWLDCAIDMPILDIWQKLLL